jgi:hypothetical protein
LTTHRARTSVSVRVIPSSARLARRERGGERQARVVGRSVVVARATAQAVRAKPRLAGEQPPGAQRDMALHVAKQRERVVERERRRELPAADARAGIHGPREGQRAYQMRRDAQQDPPLAARLEHQRKLAMLQVAHAAVHQPRRPARGAAGEIVLLHECDAQPAERRITGHRGAGDPAPDDEHVEPLLGEGLQLGLPGGGGGAHRQKLERER